jgi:hypothetical protein
MSGTTITFFEVDADVDVYQCAAAPTRPEPSRRAPLNPPRHSPFRTSLHGPSYGRYMPARKAESSGVSRAESDSIPLLAMRCSL